MPLSTAPVWPAYLAATAISIGTATALEYYGMNDTIKEFIYKHSDLMNEVIDAAKDTIDVENIDGRAPFSGNVDDFSNNELAFSMQLLSEDIIRSPEHYKDDTSELMSLSQRLLKESLGPTLNEKGVPAQAIDDMYATFESNAAAYQHLAEMGINMGDQAAADIHFINTSEFDGNGPQARISEGSDSESTPDLIAFSNIAFALEGTHPSEPVLLELDLNGDGNKDLTIEVIPYGDDLSIPTDIPDNVNYLLW